MNSRFRHTRNLFQNTAKPRRTRPATEDLGLLSASRKSTHFSVVESATRGRANRAVVSIRGKGHIVSALPGLPVLVCRVRWENRGDKPLWIAYVGSGDGIRGNWAHSVTDSLRKFSAARRPSHGKQLELAISNDSLEGIASCFRL